MAIPKRLNMNAIKSAALKLVKTTDSKCVLHPEYLVAAVSEKRAERMQSRLRKTDDNHVLIGLSFLAIQVHEGLGRRFKLRAVIEKESCLARIHPLRSGIQRPR
jgi:hypothetical protein